MINHMNRGQYLFASFLCFQIVLLSVVPTLFSSAPPLDVVEGWTWAPHWLIGTYKHPPGPAWSIEIMHLVIPGRFFGPYLLSQISVALTYVFVYMTGKILMDRRRALAGTLLLAGSLYFNYFSTQFNHNVLQLPFWAAIILTFACIFKSPTRTAMWVVLGLLVGVGMYAKYSVCVIALITAFLGVLLPQIRAQMRSSRPLIAAGTALLIFAPHVMWLVQNDFLPFIYVADRTRNTGSPFEPLAFLLIQIAHHGLVLFLLACVGLSAFRAAEPRQTPAEVKIFLRVFTFAPVTLLVVVALASGKELIYMWGIPMFTTVGLWLVAEIGCDWTGTMIKRLATGATVIVAVAAMVFVCEAIWHPAHKPKRVFWPMKELAAQANAVWASEMQTPLKITGGDMWLAGLISIGLPQRPDVAVGDDLVNSPWVKPDDIAGKGMLFLSKDADILVPNYCKTHGPIHEIRLSDIYIPPAYAVVCYPDLRA